MIQIRYSENRGHADHGWLDTRHSFSFADYHDPDHMGFRCLRVINQDRVKPDSGFPTHPHRDMEILSLVLKGQLQHRDSMGNQGIVRADEVQRITAGSGIMHSEWNPSSDEEVEFLQIWILPQKSGLEPDYQQRTPQPGEKHRQWTLLASPSGKDQSVSINQEVELWRGRILGIGTGSYKLGPGRHAWLQMLRGDLQLGGKALRAGDGASVSDLERLEFDSIEGADFLLFDLP